MNKPPAGTNDQHQLATYEIRLKGHLDLQWGEQLGVPDLIHESDGTTILRGIAADQSALHGVLQRIRDLALPLISVNQIPPTPEPS